jgi:hypothetical protein
VVMYCCAPTVSPAFAAAPADGSRRGNILSAGPALGAEAADAGAEPAHEMSQEQLDQEMAKIHEEIEKLRMEHDEVRTRFLFSTRGKCVLPPAHRACGVAYVGGLSHGCAGV